MNKRLLRSIAIAVLPIAIGLLLAAPAVDAKPKPKPDLVVSRAKLLGNKYAFAGETVQIKVSDVVENEGRRKAKASMNELTISHNGAKTLRDITREVPSLEKNERSAGVGRAVIAIPADAKLGEYAAVVCADARRDVKEKNELDNCEEAGHFYVIKKTWAGTFSGTYVDSGVTESWSVPNATFTFKSTSGGGVFIYDVRATIAYEASGSDGSCSYTGAGIDSAPQGFLRFDYGTAQYSAIVSSASQYSYPIIVNCGGSPYTEYGNRTASVLEIGTATGGKALPFGTSTLSGSQAAILEPDANYTWNLK